MCDQSSVLVIIQTVIRKVLIIDFSLSASGQRYVVLGRNSLRPFDLISPDLYKISVKGLLSTSVKASFVFSS